MYVNVSCLYVAVYYAHFPNVGLVKTFYSILFYSVVFRSVQVLTINQGGTRQLDLEAHPRGSERRWAAWLQSDWQRHVSPALSLESHD